jgi:hypothetical protein
MRSIGGVENMGYLEGNTDREAEIAEIPSQHL